jgi:hypothetical protein
MPRPEPIPGASQRFGDTNVAMSDTWTWLNESIPS